MFMLARSLGVHLSFHSFVGTCYKRTLQPLLEDLRTHLRYVDLGTSRATQRPGQGPAPCRLLDAFGPGVDMGSSPGSDPVMVDGAPTGGCVVGYEANQRRHRLSSSTPDADANGLTLGGLSRCAGGFPRETESQVYSPVGG